MIVSDILVIEEQPEMEDTNELGEEGEAKHCETACLFTKYTA